MPQNNQLSKREKEVVELLLQGKSNKQIALSLGVAESTVEFHLKNIYVKLGVSSRLEAILKLGESTGSPSAEKLAASTGERLGSSTVDRVREHADNGGKPISQIWWAGPFIGKVPNIQKRWRYYVLAALIFGALWYYAGTKQWVYARECENPDQSTIGQTLQRSHASGGQVHGQFGTVPAWPPKSGYVTYNNIISFSLVTHWYLKLEYSKYSPPSVPILIFLDHEPVQRATFFPLDQGNWDKFTETQPIDLGNVWIGVHSIKLSTDGQQYGVADLDKFVLTTEPPLVVPAPSPTTP